MRGRGSGRCESPRCGGVVVWWCGGEGSWEEGDGEGRKNLLESLSNIGSIDEAIKPIRYFVKDLSM